jgi:hypothetical protein
MPSSAKSRARWVEWVYGQTLSVMTRSIRTPPLGKESDRVLDEAARSPAWTPMYATGVASSIAASLRSGSDRPRRACARRARCASAPSGVPPSTLEPEARLRRPASIVHVRRAPVRLSRMMNHAEEITLTGVDFHDHQRTQTRLPTDAPVSHVGGNHNSVREPERSPAKRSCSGRSTSTRDSRSVNCSVANER